jgi:hypothetical protein
VTETATTVLLTFRDTIRRVSPPWLQIELGEKLLYSIGVHCDAFGDAVIAAVKHRFPGLYDFESLPKLGRERRIARGRAESDASYAARLARFLTDHQIRGGPYALLTQLHHYFAPVLFDMQLVYHNGRTFTRDADAFAASGDLDESITRGSVSWSPDADTAKWARWWLFYYLDTYAITPPTDAEIAELRLIPRQWNAAHCFGTIVLFPSTGELWNWPLGHTWNEAGTWNVAGAAPIFIEVEPS